MGFYPRLPGTLLALSAIITVLTACGGGGKSVLSLLASQPDPPPGTASVLRRSVSYNYSLAGFPSQEGFTLVPMAGETEPAVSASQDCSITVEVTPGGGRKASLTASAATGFEGRGILAHLRYDPPDGA